MLIGIKYIKRDNTIIDIPLINYTECRISQDLFDPQLQGYIKLTDRDSWQVLNPIQGDKIELMVYKPIIPLKKQTEEDIDYTVTTYSFDVFKSLQTPIDLNKRPFRDLEIHFTSGNIINAYNISISKQFSNKSFQHIAQELCRLCDVKTKFFDTSLNNLLTYCSPQWSPIKIITDISNYAVSDKNKSGYMFYQDMNGILNFVTLPTLFENGTSEYTNTKYFDNSSQTIINENHSLTATNKNMNKIYTLHFVRVPNYINMIQHGMSLTNLVYFDMEKNQYVTTNKNIYDTKNMYKHLSGYLNVPEDMLNVYQNNISQVYSTSDYKNQFNTGYLNTILMKMNTMMYECIATVQGYEDRKLGQIITMEVPSQMTVTQENEEYSTPDEVYTGKYLIKGITNSFTPKAYSQQLTLITDGIQSDKYNNIMKW